MTKTGAGESGIILLSGWILLLILVLIVKSKLSGKPEEILLKYAFYMYCVVELFSDNSVSSYVS